MRLLTLPLLFYFSQSWFMQGLQHPLLTPQHIILMISLAFLIGQQGEFAKLFVIFPVAVIGGMLINEYLMLNINLEKVLLAVALIVSLLVILRIQQAPDIMLITTLLLTILTGMLLGLDSQPIRIPGLHTNSIINWYLGSLLTIAFSVSIVSLIAFVLRRFGEGIILRVLGSWIATSAIIVLTLKFV